MFAATRLKPTDAEIIRYLWANVNAGNDDECWPWAGRAQVKGRGVLNYRGIRRLAPRVAYRAKTGEWPPDDMYVCHSCDNPACCNPAHLWLGTPQDNVDDMMRKGRHPLNGINNLRIKQVRQTHCKRGHKFTPENTLPNNGTGRKCRTCQNLNYKAYYRRQKDKTK